MRSILMAVTVGLALGSCDRDESAERVTPAVEANATTGPPRNVTASFDCDRARGQAQELVCGDANLAAMDREVARLAELAIAPAAQAEWAQQRDSCAKSDELRQCVMESAMLRIHRLRAGSKAARSEDGISVGPVAYSCTGLETPLLATFVTSDPGAVALEWGGQTIAIDRAATASGANYEGRWNGELFGFWSKEKEATLTIPGKGDLQCVEQATG